MKVKLENLSSDPGRCKRAAYVLPPPPHCFVEKGKGRRKGRGTGGIGKDKEGKWKGMWANRGEEKGKEDGKGQGRKERGGMGREGKERERGVNPRKTPENAIFTKFLFLSRFMKIYQYFFEKS